MRRPRFLVSLADEMSPQHKSAGRLTISLDSAQSRHLLSVLRRRKGDEVEVIDTLSGRRFIAQIIDIHRHSASLEIGEELEHLPPSSPRRVTAVVGLTKPGTADLIAEKSVEIGISSLVFFSGERSQRISAERRTRLERVIDAAMKQSGNSTAPQLILFSSLEEALESLHRADSEESQLAEFSLGSRRFLLDTPKPGTYGSDSPCFAQPTTIVQHLLSEACSPARSENSTITPLENIREPVDSYLLVGPEGGLTEAEIRLAAGYGYLSTSLGPHTMRSETAVIVASALLQLCAAGS